MKKVFIGMMLSVGVITFSQTNSVSQTSNKENSASTDKNVSLSAGANDYDENEYENTSLLDASVLVEGISAIEHDLKQELIKEHDKLSGHDVAWIESQVIHLAVELISIATNIPLKVTNDITHSMEDAKEQLDNIIVDNNKLSASSNTPWEVKLFLPEYNGILKVLDREITSWLNLND